MLEVKVAFLVEWCLLAVEEVVVKRDPDRFDAVGNQLDAESFAGRSLAR